MESKCESCIHQYVCKLKNDFQEFEKNSEDINKEKTHFLASAICLHYCSAALRRSDAFINDKLKKETK